MTWLYTAAARHLWHLEVIQAGSQFLTDTESRYSIIEVEMLAVTCAASKCRLFLYRDWNTLKSSWITTL